MPDIKLKAEQVEEKSGGEELARVIIERKDGKKAVFFVTVRIKNHRPVLELVAKKKGGDETQKDITGYWIDLNPLQCL